MKKTAIRSIAALAIAGASLLPALASAQGAYGSANGNPIHWKNGQAYMTDSSHHDKQMKAEDMAGYARQQDPQWWSQHKNQFANNKKAFVRAWTSHYEHRSAQLNQGGGAQ